jgi:predicted double-glycine peptidase
LNHIQYLPRYVVNGKAMQRIQFKAVLVTLYVGAPLLLSLSALAQDKRTPIRSLAEIRHETVIMQKWDMSCGAAALATLLTYDLSDPVTEREVATAMLHRTDPIRIRIRGGFSLLNMKQYVVQRGYQAEGYGNLRRNDLAGLLPAIVPVEFHGYDHFVVVRAIQDGMVWLADPSFGKRKIDAATFEQAWPSQIAFTVISQ